MKKTKFALLSIAIVTAALVSFKTPATTSIKGKVTPAFYGVQAWAISKTDTLYTTLENGNFQFSNVEPGEYKLIVEARSPYRHIVKDGIVVKDDQTIDIGALSFQRWE